VDNAACRRTRSTGDPAALGLLFHPTGLIAILLAAMFGLVMGANPGLTAPCAGSLRGVFSE
jgi:hypothetical protein